MKKETMPDCDKLLRDIQAGCHENCADCDYSNGTEFECSILNDCAQAIMALKTEVEKITAERNAALASLHLCGKSVPIVQWRTGFPEESNIEVFKSLGCETITVLVTGRYQADGELYVHIVNRIRRKKTGYQQIDESDALGVPLDEQWHWQSGMVEIVAWSPLPKEDDPRWISCQERLPEDTEKIHKDGRMEMISVIALCEVFEGFPDVYLVNRLRVNKTGNLYLDKQATDGWVWSKNGEIAKAWMPFPEPAKEPPEKNEKKTQEKDNVI